MSKEQNVFKIKFALQFQDICDATNCNLHVNPIGSVLSLIATLTVKECWLRERFKYQDLLCGDRLVSSEVEETVIVDAIH